MFRKLIAVSLFISFIAMATSGLMMYFIEKPSFTLQMHPVHKQFGLLLIASVIAHLCFNLRHITAYLKNRAVALFGGLLVCGLVVLYGVALTNEIPREIAIPLDKLAEEAERHE